MVEGQGVRGDMVSLNKNIASPPNTKHKHQMTLEGWRLTDVCLHSQMTDVYEGSLIRCFRRLEECLRQIAQAAKVMGSEDLETKFETALKLVKRDIVAAQSLYL